jgi:hypothetical protein
MKKLQNKLFPFLIALSALAVSASAAFYSVSGLSKLFAGAALAVTIMAASLEVSKLVIASLLYQYRKTLPVFLKIYLSIAAVVLIGITSMGIYGFLSSAYQETANKDGLVTQQVEALETKKKLYEDTRNNIVKEKQSLAELKGTLSKGSTTQFTDRKGNLVVRSNNAAVKQIESANKSDENLTNKLDIVNDSIFSLETQILEIKTNGDAASELGPLKYLSELTGVEMNKIINWLLLVIIFVFDPLAIALVIAANFAFEQSKSKTKENIYGETIPLEDQDEIIEDQDETIEWDEYGNPSPIIDDEVEELEHLRDPDLIGGLTVPKENGFAQFINKQDEFDLDGDGILNPEEQKRKEIDQKLDEIDMIQNQPMDFLNMQRQLSSKYTELRKLKQELDEIRNPNSDIITYN